TGGHRDRTGGDRDRTGGHRDRTGAPSDRYSEDDVGRTPYSDRSSRPPYYPAAKEHTPEASHGRDSPRERPHEESKCSYICSRRGIVLICSVLTNMLVLICVVAAQMVGSGISAMGGLSTFNINSNFNLQGTQLQQARDLDMQYSQMRAPGVYGGIAFSLVFAAGSLLFAVSGSKPPHRMPRKTLYGALVFQAVGAVAYVVAVGLYLHFVITVNATDVCQKRERVYASGGYTWMNCDVGGAEAAVALFGLITAILYGVGTGLTVQTVRGVRRYLHDRKRHHQEAAQRRPADGHNRAPLSVDTNV
ncbi:hypothetical protein CRUP_012139, partial [Coryphaenoides rupestris]